MSRDDPKSAEPVGEGEYVVRSGDCITSIAAAHGHFWQTLWSAPENADLKAAREDPNVLLTGDRVFIPELREKLESCGTESKHRFRKKGVPAKLRLRLLLGSKPRRDLRYTLTIDETTFKGRTTSEGIVEAPLPPHAREGKLVLHVPGGDEIMRLDLGSVEPIRSVLGVQQRLLNLGIRVALSGVLDAQTRRAIEEFQARIGHRSTGELGDDLYGELERAHGC
jgi:hypothetical protein